MQNGNRVIGENRTASTPIKGDFGFGKDFILWKLEIVDIKGFTVF